MSIVYDVGQIQTLAEEVLVDLQDNGVSPNDARVVLALCIAHMMTPVPMEDDTQVKAIQAILEHAGLYFIEGEVN